MSVLSPAEYDASYFDGANQRVRHNAGYSSYQRWFRNDGPGSLGEYWADFAQQLTQRFSLVGSDALEIGCAKGFLVGSLRSFGVNARGIDVSDYAISCAEPEVRPFLTHGNVCKDLSLYRDEQFDFVLSKNFLECLSDEDLAVLIPELNRISKHQAHVVGIESNPEFYNHKSLQDWADLDWKPGAVLVQTLFHSEVTK